jgi:Kef-type K+ transport system membrane component KefB
MTVADFLLQLLVIFAAAKLFGELAERIGQPAVLGEMVGGILVGVSGLQLVDPGNNVIHLLAQLGVIMLLFLIGLETDLPRLLSVGGPALLVAVVGVALPMAAGFGIGAALGYPHALSLFIGASLTATSVGITARVLSDLGHLKDPESQVILGAAVLDDIIGLVLLALLNAVAGGKRLTVLAASRTTLIAFGFVIVAIVVGSLLAPLLIRLITRLHVGQALLFASMMLALALAWIAESVGSALIIGSFAAGVVLARTEKAKQLDHEVHDVAQFFIPIFFVSVGAAVDLKAMTTPFLLLGVLLTVVGVVGKVLAGFVAWGENLRRIVIGFGMVPRGEVGLIFAQIGLSAGLLSMGVYSAIAMMIILTTLMTPPILRALLVRQSPQELGGVAECVSGVLASDVEAEDDTLT